MNKMRKRDYRVFITDEFVHLADPIVNLVAQLPIIKDKLILRDSRSTFAAVVTLQGYRLHIKLSKPRSFRYLIRHLPPRYGRILHNFKTAILLNRLNLPCIVPVAALFRRRFLILKESVLITFFIEGSLLSELLKSGKVSDSHIKALAKSVADFHNAGVFHGDLKPANIIFTEEQNAILCDYDNTKIMNSLTPKQTAKDISRIKHDLSNTDFKIFLAEYLRLRNLSEQDKRGTEAIIS